MNKVLLIGNLGRNPEIKATKTGNQMAHFSLATSREFVNRKTGERKEITDVTAEFIAPAQGTKPGTGNFNQFGPSSPEHQPMEQQSMNFGEKDEDIPF